MVEILGEGWPLLAVASLFGLLVGSFLNVVILRLPARLMHEWRQQSREMLELDDEGRPRAAADAPLIADGVAVAPQTPASAELQAAADAAAAAPSPADLGASAATASRGDAAPPSGADDAPPDLVFKGSHCLHCKHPLSPLDNIPLLSWLALRGRCRYCKTPISVQYPLVEALTAVAAFIVVWRYGFTLQSAAGLLLTFSLIALSGIDIRTQLLPDAITQPLLWLGLLLALPGLFVAPADAILGAVVGYLSLWSVYWGFKLLTGKEGMGYGDFKLLSALGAWMGVTSLLPIVLLASLVGAVVGAAVLFLRRQGSDTPIPFGPFIAAAGWLQFVWGGSLMRWYEQLLFA